MLAAMGVIGPSRACHPDQLVRSCCLRKRARRRCSPPSNAVAFSSRSAPEELALRGCGDPAERRTTARSGPFSRSRPVQLAIWHVAHVPHALRRLNSRSRAPQDLPTFGDGYRSEKNSFLPLGRARHADPIVRRRAIALAPNLERRCARRRRRKRARSAPPPGPKSLQHTGDVFVRFLCR